jgi:hypothetical protein
MSKTCCIQVKNDTDKPITIQNCRCDGDIKFDCKAQTMVEPHKSFKCECTSEKCDCSKQSAGMEMVWNSNGAKCMVYFYMHEGNLGLSKDSYDHAKNQAGSKGEKDLSCQNGLRVTTMSTNDGPVIRFQCQTN